MTKRGQATTEMIFILPLLIMFIGGSMFIVYTCWQGIKVQQAANFAARIQGQERVSGGRGITDINQENGTGPGVSGDDDPTATKGSNTSEEALRTFAGRNQGRMENRSVYGKLYNLVKDMFPGAQSEVYIPLPTQGQNVDKVKIVRVINLRAIPFMNWFGAEQIKLEGTAWGGEDTAMYGLPRWGRTGSGSGNSNALPEWKNLILEPARSGNHD